MAIDSEIKPGQELNEEEWNEKINVVRDLCGNIMDLTDELFNDESIDGIPKASIKEEEINRRIMDRFGEDELLKYGAWHAFVGSTIDKEKCKGFDMPGDEIQEVIKEEIKQLEKLKKENQE